MMNRPPRPRAFRLDDARVAVDDAPAPLAPAAIIHSQHDPIPVATAPARIDQVERQVEAAQKSGLISRCRSTWSIRAGAVATGIGSCCE